MRITQRSESAPGLRNEDLVISGRSWVAVLDGATAVPGRDTGCVHDVAWLVAALGKALRAELTGSSRPLPAVVGEAIRTVRRAHGPSCDLSNPDSPSTTITILRQRSPAELDYLALADSPLLLDIDSEVTVVTDGQIAVLTDRTYDGVSRARNQEGGFWVASTNPAAADHGATGSVPVASVRRAALLTDGAARLVERFGLLGWAELLDLLEQQGPAALIARTREAERERPAGRGKQYDDATAVYVDPQRDL